MYASAKLPATRSQNLAACALLLCSGFVGCTVGPKLGAVPVSGKVTYKGKPSKYGTVTFMPVGEKGRPCIASIRDGQYTAYALTSQEGLAPGEYQVSVVYSDKPLMETPGGSGVPEPVAERYRTPATSGLTLTVPDGGSAITYDIELKD
jgi:hypothetical protein